MSATITDKPSSLCPFVAINADDKYGFYSRPSFKTLTTPKESTRNPASQRGPAD